MNMRNSIRNSNNNNNTGDNNIIQVNNSLANLKLKENSHSRIVSAVPDDNANSFLVGITPENLSAEIHKVNYDKLDKNLNRDLLYDFNTLDKENQNYIEIYGIYPKNISDLFCQVYNFCSEKYELILLKKDKEKYTLNEFKDLKSNTIFDLKNFEDEKKLPYINFIDNKTLSIYDLNKTCITNSINLYKNDTYPLKISSDISKLDAQILGIALNDDIFFCDYRNNKITKNIKNAHNDYILNIQFDPLEPYLFCTSGTDFSIKFWDMRKTDREVYGIYNNSHWIWDYKFNKNYGNMLVSCSSSSLVRTYIFNNNEEKRDLNNMTFIDYYEFEDSVYSIDWAKNDSWLFAAISFNAIFHINTIPEDIKYKVML